MSLELHRLLLTQFDFYQLFFLCKMQETNRVLELKKSMIDTHQLDLHYSIRCEFV